MSRNSPSVVWMKKHVGKPWLGEKGLEYKEIFDTLEVAEDACKKHQEAFPDRELMQPYECKFTDDFDEGETGPLHFHIGRPRKEGRPARLGRKERNIKRSLDNKIDRLKREYHGANI